jgi:hypothetical protein
MGGTWRNATVAKTASVKRFDDGPSRRFGLHRAVVRKPSQKLTSVE